MSNTDTADSFSGPQLVMGDFSVGGSSLLTQPRIRSRAEGQALADYLRKKKEKEKANGIYDRHNSSFLFTNVPSDSPSGFSPGRSTLTHSVFTGVKGPRLQCLHK